MEKGRKRGYYVYYTTNIGLVGVDKKVDNQIRVFGKYFDISKIVIPREKSNAIKSIMWRLPFFSFGRNYSAGLEQIKEPDFIYIRYVPVDLKFLAFIRTLRQTFPKCKIVLEIATFPVKKELLMSKTMWPFYFKNQIHSQKLKKYVDKVVTYNVYKVVYGIPTIRISNGICLDEVKPRENFTEGETINLLAIAIFQKSHGYERCIRGLYEYYNQGGKRNIVFHMVGDGEKLKYYKGLVKKFELSKYVIFYGKKEGKELDDIYEKADIALGCFGAYKRGIVRVSALKTREYLAKGLPLISGCTEDVFERENERFYLEFPNDNSVIDINKVVKFYDELYKTNNDKIILQDEIREFAHNKIDMSTVLLPVIDYLRG